MKRLLLLALFATPAFAADDPNKQLVSCQQELIVTRGQRNEEADKIAAIVANANAQIQALQKRIQEMDAEKAKK